MQTVFNGPWIAEIALQSGPTHFRCFTALLATLEFSHHMWANDRHSSSEIVCCAMQRSRMELLTIWSLWSEVFKAVFHRRVSLCTIKVFLWAHSFVLRKWSIVRHSCPYSQNRSLIYFHSGGWLRWAPGLPCRMKGAQKNIDFKGLSALLGGSNRKVCTSGGFISKKHFFSMKAGPN